MKGWDDPEAIQWFFNLCINLVITKYKLKSQYVKLTQLWPVTELFQSEFCLIWQAYQKYVSFAHM